MRMIILVAHNLRSAHNVGSLLRTADGLGIDQVVLSGYTPYPQLDHDDRLPHISRKVSAQIHKTALGAEASVQWTHAADIAAVMQQLSGEGFTVAALEQAPGSQDLTAFTPPSKLAIVVGRETEGLEPEILAACGICLEIPMFGSKESYNVVQAAAMALYHCRFAPE